MLPAVNLAAMNHIQEGEGFAKIAHTWDSPKASAIPAGSSERLGASLRHAASLGISRLRQCTEKVLQRNCHPMKTHRSIGDA